MGMLEQVLVVGCGWISTSPCHIFWQRNRFNLKYSSFIHLLQFCASVHQSFKQSNPIPFIFNILFLLTFPECGACGGADSEIPSIVTSDSCFSLDSSSHDSYSLCPEFDLSFFPSASHFHCFEQAVAERCSLFAGRRLEHFIPVTRWLRLQRVQLVARWSFLAGSSRGRVRI